MELAEGIRPTRLTLKEYTGWEWLPRARVYPSEVDIEKEGNRENEHEMTKDGANSMTEAIWTGIGDGPMMMRTMKAAAR
jgi:hypothetical protein